MQQFYKQFLGNYLILMKRERIPTAISINAILDWYLLSTVEFTESQELFQRILYWSKSVLSWFNLIDRQTTHNRSLTPLQKDGEKIYKDKSAKTWVEIVMA